MAYVTDHGELYPPPKAQQHRKNVVIPDPTDLYVAPHEPQQHRKINVVIPDRRDSRQQNRLYLFRVAFSLVTEQNSHKADNPHGKDGKHWFISMARSERRKLARAYAAGEWRRQSPETRGRRSSDAIKHHA